MVAVDAVPHSAQPTQLFEIRTSCHYKVIADGGPCGKAPGVGQNRFLARQGADVTTHTTGPIFHLTGPRTAKADPTLIGDDERHLQAVADCLADQIATLETNLADLRKQAAGKGTRALDRDLEIHSTTRRLRLLERFDVDICLGRMVPADGSAPVHIGRIGLVDRTGTPLLVDWRAPAAEPFFAATRAHPMGLVSRRRYRWTAGQITDYWDEILAGEADTGPNLDDESAFIASLGASRSPQMRDVLATLQTDQDAIIRSSSHGALVVDGGPGTGKTVVALHRAAYLLHSDPRLEGRRGGVLVVGPHHRYLAYVSDVLPSLGEDGVRLCTIPDLLAEGASADPETDPEVARLKEDARMAAAIEPAIRLYEEAPTETLLVETDWDEVEVDTDDWAAAFSSVEPGLNHNEARAQVWETLVGLIIDKHPELDDVTDAMVAASLRRNKSFTRAFSRAWPLIDPAELVGDLWSVRAYLRRCAPWLSADEISLLQRDDPQAWTLSDLPLLDAARARIGEPEAVREQNRRAAAESVERAERAAVIDEIIEGEVYDDGEGNLKMLHGQDLREALIDTARVPLPEPEKLAGPYVHIIVDEAQELSDAQWQMLIRRCPSRSFTVVGDRAQARTGFTETWTERLERLGFGTVDHRQLDVNYRTPSEVMAAAEPVIRAVLPDANVPTSIRDSGIEVRRAEANELQLIVDQWLADHAEGTVGVIGEVDLAPQDRVQVLSAAGSKGLEFDLVVVVGDQPKSDDLVGTVDRYVAMTRATRELVLLTV